MIAALLSTILTGGATWLGMAWARSRVRRIHDEAIASFTAGDA